MFNRKFDDAFNLLTAKRKDYTLTCQTSQCIEIVENINQSLIYNNDIYRKYRYYEIDIDFNQPQHIESLFLVVSQNKENRYIPTNEDFQEAKENEGMSGGSNDSEFGYKYINKVIQKEHFVFSSWSNMNEDIAINENIIIDIYINEKLCDTIELGGSVHE